MSVVTPIATRNVAAPRMTRCARNGHSAADLDRRAQPNISLAWIAYQMPIKQDADQEHYLEGFRRAGLD
jgi:hypothetical protein